MNKNNLNNENDIIENNNIQEDIIENTNENNIPNENIIEEIENITKSKEDIEREKQNIHNMLAKEKFEKKQKNKAKTKKVAKSILKTGDVASCFLCLGVGVGSGIIISENFISKQEQSSFKFDVDLKDASLKENIILTSNSASSIFKEVGDSVVNISTKASSGFFTQELQDLGSGSGIIYKVDGDKVYILTNNHVIEGASYVTISVKGKNR